MKLTLENQENLAANKNDPGPSEYPISKTSSWFGTFFAAWCKKHSRKLDQILAKLKDLGSTNLHQISDDLFQKSAHCAV